MELLAAGPDGELVPIEKTLAPAQSTTTAPGPLDTITNLFGGDAPLLSPDEAFQFSVAPADGDTLMARWVVADGYYLYRDKMRLALKDTPGVSLGAISLPAGEIKQDEFFGRVQIYRQDVEVLLPLARTGGGAKTITVQARYQGCAEAGVCFPPITRQASLELPAYAVRDVNSRTRSLYTRNLSGARLGAKPFRSDQDRFAQLLTSQPLWFSALAFFGAGLLLTFTPCVFPMIPILSGIIAGQGQRIDARKAFVLSLTFVMAMAVTYTVAGVIVGLSGENVQAWFQNPWVIFVFALIFVLLALSMFGFYELQMPTAVQSRLSELSRRQEGGTFIGAGIMGVLSALIVGPCVTAPLIGALLVIAYTGDALLGGTALFALALGMGAPLLVIGTYEGKLMPRAGPWMETIKAIFGVLLLGLAIWLLGRVLPSATSMALWALLLIVSGIYMGAFDSIRQGASGWFRLWKGLGLAMSIYGALLLVGASGGGDDVLQPLKGVLVARGDAQDQEGLHFRQIKGPDELRRAIASANKRGKPVMLDFYADWCVSCKEMERYTFSDERVQAALSEAVLLQADVTANDVQDRALLRSLNLFGPPAILFYTPTGHERHDWRVVGYMPAERFHRHVRQALGTASSAS
jgi:thiol:disulfide interchange protein DsbD